MLDGQHQPTVARLAGAHHVGDGAMRQLATEWLRDGLNEHASIASFFRAADELRAVGAPQPLVDACLAAARDEDRHADACFALAHRYGARFERPGLVTAELRAPELARLAVDTFVEGCVGETIAALAVLRARASCEDSPTRAALSQIAADESRHAELAWATVAWAIRQGGAEVRKRVAQTAHDIAQQLDAPAMAPSSHDLARYGRLGPEQQARVAIDAWTAIIAPSVALLCGDVDGGIYTNLSSGPEPVSMSPNEA